MAKKASLQKSQKAISAKKHMNSYSMTALALYGKPLVT